jgi:hypothetical protein
MGDKSSLDRTKTDSEVGSGNSRTGEDWMVVVVVVGDRHEKSKGKGNYGDLASWESNAAGWKDKGTGLGSSQVVVDSSGEWNGQRHDGRH